MRKTTMNDVLIISKKYNLNCLSDTYINCDTKMLWKCSLGHVFECSFYCIKNGTGCAFCAGNARLKLEDLQKIAKLKNGKLISTIYKNNKTNLLWQCKYNHTWNATADNVKKGKWCPVCMSGRGERITRLFFEHVFGYKFPSIKPKWLINSFGNRMQLDGYCAELGIAFEHQGLQHYKISDFYKTKEAFNKRQNDDICKIDLCKLNNIKLFIIPQVPTVVNIDKLSDFIINLAKELNVLVPFPNIKINFNDEIMLPNNIQYYDKCKKIIINKGGKLLSKYLGTRIKIKVRCHNGHVWYPIPGNLFKGHWCPHRCFIKKEYNDFINNDGNL